MDFTARRCRFGLPWLGVLLPLVLNAADDPVDRATKAATEWMKTRSETVRLETDWSGQHELLEATIKAIEDRARLAEETVDQVKARTAQGRAELEAIETRNDAAGQELAAATTKLTELSRGLQTLQPFLPPRLRSALELPYKSLQATDLTVGERMQHAATILNRCLQFNRVVTAGDETLVLPGENGPKNFEVIYWGLSHGYALDRQGGKAWVGTVGPGGWQWEAHPEAFKAVAVVLATARDKGDPSFVVLPAKLNHPAR